MSPSLVSRWVRVGAARYVTRVAPLDAGRRIPRAEREKRAEALARAFADLLETTGRHHPDRWFEFTDPPKDRPAA